MDPRQARPATRPRSKSGFSFRSDKSGNSSTKAHKRKESLVETKAEKRKTHMSTTTKANPNAAINEAQPIALALEKSTLSSLQNIKCNDVYGNPINDPDKSNPTRWRMERPLETIRSFEIAIDREYAHRQSSFFPPAPGGAQSRRTSYWGGNQANGPDPSGRYSGGQSGNAGYGASRDSFGENGYSGYGPGPTRDPRAQSDPMLNKYGPPPGVYPAVGSSRSKDTLNTGASSGSEHWNNSAGAASEEGSLERAHGVARPLPHQQRSGYMDAPEGYPDENRSNLRFGQNVNGPPGYMGYPTGHVSQVGNQLQGQDGGPPPRPPAKDPRMQNQSNQHIQLSANQVPTGAVQPHQEQRQSWFKKRFSRGK